MSKNRFFTPNCVIYTCCGSKCKKQGGKHLYKMLKQLVKDNKLRKNMQVIKTGCTDRCKLAPIVAVMPENEWHHEVTESQGISIFNKCSENISRKD